MKKSKEIKFSIKRKDFIDEDMEIEEFIKQVDDNIEKMDYEFRKFQRTYGANKSFHDWIAYEEEEKRKKEAKVQSKVETLSSLFKEKLNS